MIFETKQQLKEYTEWDGILLEIMWQTLKEETIADDIIIMIIEKERRKRK